MKVLIALLIELATGYFKHSLEVLTSEIAAHSWLKKHSNLINYRGRFASLSLKIADFLAVNIFTESKELFMHRQLTDQITFFFFSPSLFPLLTRKLNLTLCQGGSQAHHNTPVALSIMHSNCAIQIYDKTQYVCAKNGKQQLHIYITSNTISYIFSNSQMFHYIVLKLTLHSDRKHSYQVIQHCTSRVVMKVLSTVISGTYISYSDDTATIACGNKSSVVHYNINSCRRVASNKSCTLLITYVRARYRQRSWL